MAEALTFDPFDAANTADPYPVYQRLLRDAPVYRNQERDFWALSRFDDVKDAIMDWEHYSSAEGVRIDDLLELAGPSPLTMDPPRHALLRNIVRKPFAPRAIAEMTPMIERNVDALLAGLAAESGPYEVVSRFAKLLPVAVICDLLGVPAEDAPMLKGWADAMLETVPGQVGSTPAAIGGASSLRAYWLAALDERRADPRADILTAIATAEVDGSALPADEQVGMCNLVFEAGNATTGTLIANAVLALATYPDQRAWLAAHPECLTGAIEEFLRWESPVQGLMRVTKQDVEVHGVRIPAGQRVLLVLGAANRDPSVWQAPDELRLDREVIRNLAFGEGIHHCLGAPLARLEAPIALERFLAAFPDYRVQDVTRFHDVSMRTLKALWIEPSGATR
ncbi:MAG: cytochrome P450 [Actinomycetales bacterium]|nr:cytochrome P450 [Actinomycetales bacterium]